MSKGIVRGSICWERVCESGVNHVLVIGCLMKYIPFRTSKRTVAIPRKSRSVMSILIIAPLSGPGVNNSTQVGGISHIAV